MHLMFGLAHRINLEARPLYQEPFTRLMISTRVKNELVWNVEGPVIDNFTTKNI